MSYPLLWILHIKIFTKGEVHMKQIPKKLLTLSLIFIMTFSLCPTISTNVNAEEIVQTEITKPIKISKKKLKLKVGQNKKLILKNATGKVKWESKNANIAKVGRKGVVRAKKSGKTTIIAKYNGKKYKCRVTVISNAKQTSKSSSSNRSGNGSSNSSGSSTTKSTTVYWVPNGSVYHYSRNCPTLSRSRTIYSGTISQSGKGRACKVCG